MIPFVLCAVMAFSWVPIPMFSRRGTPNLKELPDPPVARKPREGGLRTGIFPKLVAFESAGGFITVTIALLAPDLNLTKTLPVATRQKSQSLVPHVCHHDDQSLQVHASFASDPRHVNQEK